MMKNSVFSPKTGNKVRLSALVTLIHQCNRSASQCYKASKGERIRSEKIK